MTKGLLLGELAGGTRTGTAGVALAWLCCPLGAPV